jgi:hypothetical protein
VNKTLAAENKKLEQAYSQEDMFSEEHNEDAEIMKSIAYAEKKIGQKMDTPKKVRDPDQPFAPVKYDIEQEGNHIDFQNLNSDGSPSAESNKTAMAQANVTKNSSANTTANVSANVSANTTSNKTANKSSNATKALNKTVAIIQKNQTSNATANVTKNQTAKANTTANATKASNATVKTNSTANATKNVTKEIKQATKTEIKTEKTAALKEKE